MVFQVPGVYEIPHRQHVYHANIEADILDLRDRDPMLETHQTVICKQNYA